MGAGRAWPTVDVYGVPVQFNLERQARLRITYEPEVDALSIFFKETTVTTRELGDGIAADYDAEGHLAGIEILDAAKRLGEPSSLDELTVEGIEVSQPPGR